MEGYLYLAGCILCTAAIITGLKEVQRRGMDVIHVITFNYFTASLTGLAFSPGALGNITAHGRVLPLALLLGLLFFSIFFVMARVAHDIGMGFMTIVAKMSMIIPVLFSFLYYHEPLGPWQWAGITASLAAIWLVNLGKGRGEGEGLQLGGLLLILVLFLGNGVNDTLFKVFEKEFSAGIGTEDFLIGLFLTAGVIGSAVSGWRMARGGRTPALREAVGGLLIGVPNFFSILFLVMALPYFPGTFYPLNNIGLLLVASLIGIVLYREHFSWLNLAGLGAAILAILLMV